MAENTDNSNRPKPISHEDLSNKWVGAGHLKAGDRLKKADGTLGTVVYVNTLAETRKMYNLEVQSAHTFFVGDKGWLTHNSGGRCGYNDRFGYGAGPATTIETKALDLIKMNGDSHRVTYYINDGKTKVELDLGGASHYGKVSGITYSTPHVKISEANIIPRGPRAGEIGGYSPKSMRDATIEDLRLVEQILKRRAGN